MLQGEEGGRAGPVPASAPSTNPSRSRSSTTALSRTTPRRTVTGTAPALDAIAGQGATGFQAYSEGVHDDVNKALLAGLASGKAPTADEALREYAARYLGAVPEDAAAWAGWLGGWADRAAVDLPAARAAFEQLAGRATTGWRLAHLRSKIDLEELDRAIAAGGDWDGDRFALVERLWAAQERLNREVYGLGPVRYVVSLRTIMPAWYDSWRQARGTTRPATVSSRPLAP